MKKAAVVSIIFLMLTGIVVAEESPGVKIKDLEKKLTEASGKGKIEILNALAYGWLYQSPETSIKYAEEALALSREIMDARGEAKALKNIGIGHRWVGDNKKALEYFQQSLESFEKLDDKKNIAAVIKETGIVNLNLGNYEAALEYFLRSLDMVVALGDKRGTANCTNNIGVVYFSLKDYEKAREYYLKSLRMEQELGDKKSIADAFYNVAQVNIATGDREQASTHLQEALTIFLELGDKDGLADTFMLLGLIYSQGKDFQKSEESYLKALKIVEDLGLKWKIAVVAGNFGECYLAQKKYDHALKYVEKGLLLAKELDIKDAIQDDYRILSEIYAGKGDYNEAFRYHKLFFDMYKKMFNENRSKQIAEMQTRYETLKKEKEIVLLTKNTEILEKNNKIHRLTKNVFIMGFILVSIILALLFKKYLYLFSFWKKQKFAGRFRLVEEIGSGGMGTVYKAHTIRNKSEIAAVKVLKQDLLKDESYRKRFKQEATIIDKLNHPNIVKIIERGESEEKLYIAMELLQGKTLAATIAEEGKLDLNACFHIMEQIADALVLIHGKDIVHRDIKPSNVLLIERNGDANFVKLLDFGLAKMKFQTSLTSSGILVGTLNFVAPEQLTNSEYSPAGDVYALGVTFYEMVTGRIVFPGDTATDIMKQVLDKTPIEPNRFRTEIPLALNDLIMRMMAKKKEARPSVKDVLEKLKTMRPDRDVK